MISSTRFAAFQSALEQNSSVAEYLTHTFRVVFHHSVSQYARPRKSVSQGTPNFVQQINKSMCCDGVDNDFGDGVRTGAATAHEDEADLHLVTVDRAKYQAFREGYLEVTQDCLSPLEIQLLPLAGPLLSYIMGVRFLTDFLDGDIYYKTAYPDHNLVRASNQLKLTEEFLSFTYQ